MATIEVKMEINATSDVVWDIISNVDGEPKYWKGTKSVRNISCKENLVQREIIIAFRDQKCLQDVYLYPKEKIVAVFTKGIIDGQKTVSLSVLDSPDGQSTLLCTVWEIKLTGLMSLFTKMLSGHIRNGTEIAMQAIKDEAEKTER